MPTPGYDLAKLIPPGLYASQARQLLVSVRTELPTLGQELPSRDSLDALLRGIAASQDVSSLSFYSLLRTALVWPAAAPDLFETMQSLGGPEVLARLDLALLRLGDVA